jgi:hypothetical protein
VILVARPVDDSLEERAREYLRLAPLSDQGRAAWGHPDVVRRRRALDTRLTGTVRQEIAAAKIYTEVLGVMALTPIAKDAIAGLTEALELATGELHVITTLLLDTP